MKKYMLNSGGREKLCVVGTVNNLRQAKGHRCKIPARYSGKMKKERRARKSTDPEEEEAR